MKKILVSLIIFLVAVSFAKAPQKVVQPRFESISFSDSRLVIKEGNTIHRLGVRYNAKGEKVVVDTLINFIPPQDENYYSDVFANAQQTSAGQGYVDTVIMRYNLLAPGYVKKVFMQNKHAGTASLQIWGPCFHRIGTSRWVNLPENPYTGDDGTQVPGAQPFLPWSSQLACVAIQPANQFNALGQWVPQWNTFDLDVLYPGGLNPLLSGDSTEIWVGYGTDAATGPTIWQDQEYQQADWWWDIYSFSTLKAYSPEAAAYYAVHSTGDPQGGPYNALNHILMIEVEYPNAPPFIQELIDYSNVYATIMTIRAQIFELEGDAFTAVLRHKVGVNGTTTNTAMTSTGGNWYEGQITGSVGDTIYYGVVAEDTGGMVNSVGWYDYVIKQPPAGANVLMINTDNAASDSLFRIALQNANANFVIWNMTEEGGLHRSVVNHPNFGVIFVAGYGTNVIPVTNQPDIHGFADYLAGNKGLVLCDPDWFYKNNLPATGTFQPGQFACDYFGLGAYENDPNDGSNSTADLEFRGVTGDPISSPFVTSFYGPLVYELLGWANWGDFVSPRAGGAAKTIFFGRNSNKSMAVYNFNGFRTIYYGFSPQVVATSQFAEFNTLVANMLLNMNFIPGDVNQDGQVRVNDIVITVQIILENMVPTPYQLMAADVNNDGAVTVADIVMMVNIILGSGKYATPNQTSMIMNGNNIELNSDGDVAGLQFMLRASEPLTLQAAPGVEVAYRQTGELVKVVVYTLGQALPTGEPLITLNQPAEISGEIIAADRSGKAVDVQINVAQEYALYQNFPNPFNPTTNISYNLPRATLVQLSVYNLLGQKVIDLVDAHQTAGIHTVQWNGMDLNGKSVPTGIYLYKLKADQFSGIRKMFFVK